MVSYANCNSSLTYALFTTTGFQTVSSFSFLRVRRWLFADCPGSVLSSLKCFGLHEVCLSFKTNRTAERRINAKTKMIIKATCQIASLFSPCIYSTLNRLLGITVMVKEKSSNSLS